MIKKVLILFIFLISVLVSNAQNLIKNGSFEQGRDNWMNWKPPGMPMGTLFEVGNDCANYGLNLPPDGRNFVEVDIESNFSQLVNTIPGKAYILKFAITRRYNCNGDRNFKVMINDKNVFNKLVNATIFGKDFEYQEVKYVAAGNRTSINFYTIGSAGSGPTYGVMLDDISFFEDPTPINQVPEFVIVKGIVKDETSGLPMRVKIEYEWSSAIGHVWSDSITGAFKLIGFPCDKIVINVNKRHYFSYQSVTDIKNKAMMEVNVPLKPMAIGVKMILKNVLFDRSKYSLKDSSKAELDQLVEMMEKNPEMNIRLLGHTDNVGDDKKNMQLSLDRIKEVRKYLVQQGISIKRIQCVGKGETQPIVDNNDESKKHLNRRVEIEILKI